VKPPKAKPKVQTFGHELPQPLNLDSCSVKPPKAKPKLQTQTPNSMEHPTLFFAQNNPSNLTTKILPMIDFLIKKNDGLSTIVGFVFMSNPNFLRESVAFV
jgi:hypothetical protein